MRVGDMKTLLLELWEGEEAEESNSILLLGPPGIGKSTAVREVAEELAEMKGLHFYEYDDTEAQKILQDDKAFVFLDLRLTEVEPSDLIGIPRDVDGAVAYKPLLWARVLHERPGVLFLDELTNVQRLDVISASYKIILDRRAGFVKFHPEVKIVAAGNRPEESSVANMLPAPLINRFLVIDVDPPTIQGWANWMTKTYEDRWDTMVYGFLMAFKDEDYFIKVPKEPETLENFPTPRSWTGLALKLYRLTKGGKIPRENFRDVIVGSVGSEVGYKFIGFVKTRVDLNALLNNPAMFNELNTEAKYMTSLMLASNIQKSIKKKAEMQKILKLVDVMTEESPEYIILTAMSMPQKALQEFLTVLFRHNMNYLDILSEIIELREKSRAR